MLNSAPFLAIIFMKIWTSMRGIPAGKDAKYHAVMQVLLEFRHLKYNYSYLREIMYTAMVSLAVKSVNVRQFNVSSLASLIVPVY